MVEFVKDFADIENYEDMSKSSNFASDPPSESNLEDSEDESDYMYKKEKSK